MARGESLSTCQPYHAGAVSQVCPSAAQRTLRGLRTSLVMEEAVHGWACAADVGAERAECNQLLGEWRRGEIVRGERGEVARAFDALERVEQRGAAVVPPLRAVSLVERRVDRRGRRASARRSAGRARSRSPAAGRSPRASCRRRSRAAVRRRGRTAHRRRASPRCRAAPRAAAAPRASRSPAGVRLPRRSCRRRVRRPRECASRSSRASAVDGSVRAPADSSASRTSVSPAKPSTRVCSAGSTSMRSAMPMRW